MPNPDDDQFGQEQLAVDEVKRRASVGATSLLVRGVGIRAAGLLGNIVLARLLTPRDFGLLALGAAVASVADFISSGGLSAALTNAPSVSRRELRVLTGFQLAIVVPLTAIAASTSIVLGVTGLLVAVMVSSLIIDTVRVPNALLLERRLDYSLIVRAEMAETIAWNVWAVAAVLAGLGVWGVATAQLFRALVGASLLTSYGPIGLLRPIFSWRLARALLPLGAKFQAVAVLQLVRDQGFNFLIPVIGGLRLLGLWSIVYRLATIVGVLLESVWRVSFPAISRLLDAGHDPGPPIQRGLQLGFVLTGLVVTPLIGSAQALVPVLFGHQWDAVTSGMPGAGYALLVAGPISAIGVGYMMASGRASRMVWVAAADLVALWVVGVPLGAVWHTFGLTLGSAVAGTVVFALLAHELRAGARVSATSALVLPMAAVAAGAAPGWLLCQHWGSSVGSLVGAGLLSSAIYVGVLTVMRRSLVLDVYAVLIRAVRRSPSRG